ncbi:single-stranded DNA-binding protein [Streptomyces sp. NPDC005438]|uniref:single-stranded DNA-binding protein n=1 Tax=Streptomyces sp. NPDC005438 TaxID=3156880 RepID=UPI0033A7F18F
MNETQVTITGNVATSVEYRNSASGAPMARFRLASTIRRFDRGRGSWADAYTNFYTVLAWRSLASNLTSSITLGEPVIVIGQLKVVEKDVDGKRFISADIMASSVGHDLNRGTSAFARIVQAHQNVLGEPGNGFAGTPDMDQLVPSQ